MIYTEGLWVSGFRVVEAPQQVQGISIYMTSGLQVHLRVEGCLGMDPYQESYMRPFQFRAKMRSRPRFSRPCRSWDTRPAFARTLA